MKKTLIISHRDADGITSAVSFAWNLLDKKKLSKNIKQIYEISDIIDINYDDDIFEIFKQKKINEKDYEQLVILDFSFSIDVLLKLKKLFKDNIIWIDHHKRKDEEIQKKLNSKKIKIKGIRDHKNSASVLVWKYFKRKTPTFSKYIEDMDIWKWEIKDSKEFIAGLINLNGSFTKEKINYILSLLDENKFQKSKTQIIKKGKIIIDFQKQHIRSIKDLGKKGIFEKTKTYIINTSFEEGLVLEHLKELEEFKDIEIYIIWQKIHKINKIKVSLRGLKTSKKDLSLIAKKYGGGGHPKASGFIIDSLDEIKFK